MSNKQSPFNGINYEWTYGSDGWNVGMDENMVKLSFLSVKVVDSFESVLPSAPVAEGRSCVLPDNTVHFYVGGWYSVTPTDGEIWVVNGKEYQIVSGVFSEVLQATTLEAAVNPKIDKLMDENKTLSLGNVSGSTTITLDGKGYVQATVIGATTFIFNDSPISGEFTSWYLEIEMTGDYAVTFPATVWDGGTAPVLGTSGKYVINFKTTPTNRFGSVEVGGVNTEASQGSFIGSAVVIPGTNPTTSTSSATPPDIVTTQSGEVFLRENRRALLTDPTQIANIRTNAPWLEVGSYKVDLSANITWVHGAITVTGKIVDYLWDDPTQVYVVLASGVSGTPGRAHILTTTDFVTFTKTTGLDDTNINAVHTSGNYTYIKRVKNSVGVTNYIVVEYTETTSGDVSFYRAATYSAPTWTYTTGPSYYTYPANATDIFHVKTDSLLMIYPDSSNTGAKNIQYYNTSWVKKNVLGSSSASDIYYVDYDGASKWYMSRADGSVIDQTGTSIGISFIGGTSNANTAPIPPIVRYVPELAGWFAIEYNNFGIVNSITYQPKVYFRPDSTKIWGQIGTLPSGYKSAVTDSPNNRGSYLKARVIYWKGKLYIFGMVKVTEAKSATTDISKYVMVSGDAGITWEVIQFADTSVVELSAFCNIMDCNLDKNKPNDDLFRLSLTAKPSLAAETIVNLSPTTNMIVETNNSAASPTTTTVYTRIA